MALTIRPTPEQDALLQKIQTEFGEKAQAKALFRGCAEYVKLAPQHAQLKAEHKDLQQQYNALLKAASGYIHAQNTLFEAVADSQHNPT